MIDYKIIFSVPHTLKDSMSLQQRRGILTVLSLQLEKVKQWS